MQVFTVIKDYVYFLLVQAFVKKLKKAVAKKEHGDARRIRRNKPKYKLDHIVRER